MIQKQEKARGNNTPGLYHAHLHFNLLANKHAGFIRGIAAEEREQQVQGWETEAFDFGSTAWSCTSDEVKDSVKIAIADANTNTTGKVFGISKELGKIFTSERIPYRDNGSATCTSAGNNFNVAIVSDIARSDKNTTGEGYWVGIPLADNISIGAIEYFDMGCPTRARAGD